MKTSATEGRSKPALRGVFITNGAPAFGPQVDSYMGSAYKYGELLKGLCSLRVLPCDSRQLPDALDAADFAVVRADRYPHFLAPLGRQLPYLLLAHDLATMRDGAGDAASERLMIEAAAAVVFVSRPMLDYAAARYELPPHAVVPLRPLARDLEFEPLPKVPHSLVYAGGICGAYALGGPWSYRVYHEQFAAAIEAGWQVHVYPARCRPQDEREYSALGCVMHDPVPESRILPELSQYTAGLQVFNEKLTPDDSLRYARLAWPNKTWLYQAAGIPTVGTNPGFESSLIYAGRWGIVVPGAAGLARLREADLPVIHEESRRLEIMDNDAPAVAELLDLVTR